MSITLKQNYSLLPHNANDIHLVDITHKRSCIFLFCILPKVQLFVKSDLETYLAVVDWHFVMCMSGTQGARKDYLGCLQFSLTYPMKYLKKKMVGSCFETRQRIYPN